MERMQGRRLDAPVLPVAPALAELLPGGGLRTGGAYALGRSMALLFALLAEPSQAGSWCAVVGMPHVGVEAARAAGVDLSRLVLVPDPGERWLAVAPTPPGALSGGAGRPPARADGSGGGRAGARLRPAGAGAAAQGPWPQTEAMIDVSDPSWSGLGEGHGILSGRELTVTVTSRRAPVPRSRRLMLPDDRGRLGGGSRPARTRLPDPLPMRRAV